MLKRLDRSILLLFLWPLFLALLCLCLGFNGLFGQDSHEYYRQSVELAARLGGAMANPPTLGDYSFPSGFPFFAALLQVVGIGPALSLQMVSFLGLGLSAYWFYALLLRWMPGAHLRSKLLFVGLFLSAPVLVKATVVSMADMLALAFALGATNSGLNSIENNKGAVWAALLGALSVLCRFALAGWILPLSIAAGWQLLKNRQWSSVLGALAMLGLVFSLHVWIKLPVEMLFTKSQLMSDWTPLNALRRTFSTIDGHLFYTLPNGVWLLSVSCHPGLFLFCPGLFFLFKRTDLMLPIRHVLLACMLGYAVVIVAYPMQNLRFLLPLWAMFLLMLFPAFDRFASYGFYFFAKFTRLLLISSIFVQCAGIIWIMRPVISRSKHEQTMAASIKAQVPEGSVLYGMDYDVAMRNYLPKLQHRNVWVQNYERFEVGSYWLFSPSRLEKQWAGRNPMLNWDEANRQHRLILLCDLSDGWNLYKSVDY
jgi:hypothetical protein